MSNLRRLGAVCSLAIALLVVPAFAEEGADGGPPETAEEIFQAGKVMADEGVVAAAIDLFYRALSMKKDKRFYMALGHTLRDDGRRALSYRAFQGAFQLEPEGGRDYEGLLVQLAGMAVDVGELAEAKDYIEKLRRVDRVAGDLALVRYFFDRGEKALASGRYAVAYRSFSKALKITDEKQRAKDGCADALAALADQYSAEEKFADHLGVLLRLYRFRPLEDVAIQIRGAFLRAGKPRARREQVKKILAAHD